MDKKLTQFQIRAALEGAEAMTGNIKFMHIRQELNRLWELETLAKSVCKPYPIKGQDNYPYRASTNLEQEVKNRMEDTKKFIDLLNQSLSRG